MFRIYRLDNLSKRSPQQQQQEDQGRDPSLDHAAARLVKILKI